MFETCSGINTSKLVRLCYVIDGLIYFYLTDFLYSCVLPEIYEKDPGVLQKNSRGRAGNRSPTLQERNRACDFHRTRLLVTRSLSWIGFIGVTHRRPLLSTCWLLLCAGQRAVVKEPVVSRLVYIAVRRQSPCFTYTFTHTSISPRGVQIGLIIYVELLI